MRRTNHAERGNIFTFLFGAVAVVGIVTAATMQLISGPIKTATRVNAKNMAESQMIIGLRLMVIDAATLANSGDVDLDGYIEPREYDVVASGGITGGGSLPTTVGATRTDPWGKLYGYCVWDAGPTDNGKNDAGTGTNNRLNGANNSTDTILALVSAGPNKVFETSCLAFDGSGTDGVSTTAGSDDIVMKQSYAEAQGSAGGGLWDLKSGDNTTGNISKNLEVYDTDANAPTVSINKTTGIGDFLGVTTDLISAKTAGDLQISGNVAMGTATSSSYPLYMTDLMTNTSSTDASLYIASTTTPTGASTGTTYGAYIQNTYTPNLAHSALYGLYSGATATHTSGTLTDLYGAYNYGNNNTTGTATNVYGAYNFGRSAGLSTNIYGSYNLGRRATTSGSATSYGAYNWADNTGGGTVTNMYGTYSTTTYSGGGTQHNAYAAYNLNTVPAATGAYGAWNQSQTSHTSGQGTRPLSYGSYNYANNTSTGVVTTLAGAYNYGLSGGTGTVTTLYGGYNLGSVASGASNTNLYGSYSEGQNNKTSGTISNLYGGYNYGNNASTGTVTSLYAGYNYVNNASTGTVTDAYGSRIDFANAGGGTVTNYYGLKVEDEGSTNANYYSIYTGNTSGTGTKSFLGSAVGIGTANNPGAALHVARPTTIDGTGWSTAGVTLRVDGGTITDTSSTSISNRFVNSIGTPTLASSSAATITRASTLAIGGAPVAGTNTTILNAYALYIGSGKNLLRDGFFTGPDSGSSTEMQYREGLVGIGGSLSSSTAWSSKGKLLSVGDAAGAPNNTTITDTIGSGTVATRAVSSFGKVYMASSSAVAVTNAVTLYIEGAPNAGTNTTITNGHALYVAANNNYFGGYIGIGSGKTAPAYDIDSAGSIRTTSVILTSDARLKKNVRTLDGALDSVLKLRGVTYDWKKPANDDQKRQQVGLIAQEVEKIYPQVVATDPAGMKSVNYAALVSPIIEAVKALYHKVMDLFDIVAQLTKRIDALEAQNSALERRLEKLEAVSPATQPAQ